MTFKPGQSGNPGGRPKEEREVVQLAREASLRAIGRLIELVENANPKFAIPAATAVLDRAFGKPTQPISGDDERPPVGVQAIPSVEALARLSAEERAQLRTLVGRIAGRSEGDGEGA